MSALNLLDYPDEEPPGALDEEPAAGSDEEVRLPETPPGLDAIRAWLRKPRPWLHGLWLWIAWILSGPPTAWEWLREHGPRMAKALRRIAAEGTLARRVLERIGHLLRETAVKFDAAAQAFRDPRGEARRESGELDQFGETVRRLGERVTLGARLVSIVVSVLNRLADLFPASPPAIVPDQDPFPNDPPADTPRPPPDPDPAPPPNPEPRPPSLRSGKAEEKPPPEPPASGSSEPDSVTHSPTPDSSASDTPTPDPPTPAPPAGRPPDTPTPETPAPSTPTPKNRPRAAAAVPRQVDWEKRLKGLPPILHKWVRDLPKRPRRASLRALILNICNHREWTTSEELARFLDMHRSSLVQRHLSELVEAGLLELKYPDFPRNPGQAYRTRPEAAAPYM